MAEASQEMEKYFESINSEVLIAYDIAKKAKAKGFDPDKKIQIPLAKNMAERVEGLISTSAPEILNSGIVERIAELEKQYCSQDWRIALTIAAEVAKEKFCKFETKKKAIETGIRVGFAYVTVGVVSSPLEGLTGVEFFKRKDNGNEYFCLMYSGPIRSAGGTAASVSVLIADYVRKELGYDVYDATEKEVKRAYTELMDYHDRVTNLQFYPSEEEVTFLMQHIPVQINGDPSEKFEVSNYKDLDRIATNRIRNGFCLVTAECLSLKAPKVWKQLNKWGHDFGMEHWDFMKDFVDLQKKMKASGGGVQVKSEEKLTPDFTYIKDLVGGRPVITHPLREGGLRLRYGRARTSGFSSDAIHPASMVVMDDFIAIGSQFRTERPGKSTTLSSCDYLDGPIVKLKNGNVLRLENYNDAKNINSQVEEILFLGDILINQGDFLNRAHKLIPAGFVEEWWSLYLEEFVGKIDFDEIRLKEIIKNPIKTKVSYEEAAKISSLTKIPLHPRWIYFWKSLTVKELEKLYSILKKSVVQEDKIIISDFQSIKRSLELIGIPHNLIAKEHVVIEGDDAKALVGNLNLKKEFCSLEKTLDCVNELSDFIIKDKLGTFIGARMGRPEKAKMRELKSNPHVLFPVSVQGGRLRSLQSALDKNYVEAEFPIYDCPKCNNRTILQVCELCHTSTVKKWYCRACDKEYEQEECKLHGKIVPYRRWKIPVNRYYDQARKCIGEINMPELIKGIRGMSSVEKIPEPLVKGLLRAKHKLHVNKEGTVRYDMTEMAMTHFKPKEIGTSIDRLKELGYTKDIHGKDLINDNQICELKAQDVVLPACKESPNEGADEVLFRVCNFLDDMLEKLYGLERYYKLESKDELAGHLIVAMSPHTSAGIVSRIVGFSKTQGFFAHPLLHSIMRRDCDGDEAGLMMLLDCLLNFSRKYLPNTRGVTQDAPLVLTSKLIPSEVDDMVFDMDVVWKYPLEFYEAAEQYKYPWDIPLDKLENHLGTEKQYEGMGFTHDANDINEGTRCSSYKTLPSMKDKVFAQMRLAEKIRAVDQNDVARLIIERHFMRDIKGNLRKFSQQSFRCVNCNEIYRRPPLSGKCTKCKGKIIFTIAQGSVIKYLEPAIELANVYNLPPYLKQTLELVQARIDSVFGKEQEKQEGLNKWF